MTENKPENDKSAVAKKEEEILKFWQDNKIFEKTLDQTKGAKEFVFYDGPPFATGTPHYGHILAGTIKDAIPRYQTMKGNFVRRRWGWDCHGLPAENIVEKELGLKTKKDIEDYGIENFNEKAREMVLAYVNDWKEIVPRLGRFVDMEDDYRTMDWSYSESVMAIFKSLYDKSLIYEGYKPMQICPRCETTLSNFEVNQGYKDVTDISVTVKFELVDEPGTFILAWTTTPWTLPGNVALAINPEIDYVKIKQGETLFILAKPRLEKYFNGDFEIVVEMKGSELIGKAYKPAFDYYVNDEAIKNRENGWKIYGAEFVTTEDGTGVVHIAPGFGEDDMKLGQKEKLPFIQHVGMNGHFKPEVTDFTSDISVKPIEDPQSTDILVLKYLASKEILFSKEKIIHSYPHCYRCDTPLLNYAASSWFVEVTKFKDDLVANNKQIAWVPEHIKEGRFGKWLEGARDWAISRTRFWGAPIPVWRCPDCKKIKVVGSVKELKENNQSNGNHFFLMRHGEAENNLTDTIDCQLGQEFHLTNKGQEQVRHAAEKLKVLGIDLIVSSDFTRTKETAEMVAELIGCDKEKIIFDARLREFNVGDFLGRKWSDLPVRTKKERLSEALPGGETVLSVKKRMGDILYELNEKYPGQNILLVSHSLPLFFAEVANQGLNEREIETLHRWGSSFLNAEIKELKFQFIPHNKNYDLDLHRPYIDDLKFSCADCGGLMSRVTDVFDCWFESGSMPYAQAHWPFENSDKFDPKKGVGFPADFIAEGLDQTRGWFYSMLVLATALFDKTSYKQVIVNGIVLAQDGQKMSKRLKNYSDPIGAVNQFGADALRFYLLSSQLMHAEDLNFSDKNLGEVYRKIIMRLSNVYSFYEMYEGDLKNKEHNSKLGESKNILDQWIIARFNELVTKVTIAMDKYELDRAVRPIDEFIDDLSNWYLRRSRDRFKSDDEQDRNWAIFTTREILLSLTKVMAPFTPFIAEEIYDKLADSNRKESVHLEDWPKAGKYDIQVIEDMTKARELVEMGLALRDRKLLKVRQPISEFLISTEYSVDEKMFQIIAEEINAKIVKVSDLSSLSSEKYEIFVNSTTGMMTAGLNFEITEGLRSEGEMRELVRTIQDLRKKSGLNPGDIIDLKIVANEAGQTLINKFLKEIKKGTGTHEIKLENGEGEVKIGASVFTIEIVK